MLKIKNIFSLLSMLVFAVILTGCYTPLNISEAMQQKQNDKLYTAYNLFYTNINSIDAENIIKGDFIGYGTPLQVVKSETSSYFNDSIITFKNLENDDLLTIKIGHAKMMMRPNDVIRQLLTTTNREEINKGLTKKYLPMIEKGQVVKGMSKNDVIVTYGYPPKNRTSDITDNTWIYWNDENNSVRIVFRNGKVVEIIDLRNF